MGDNNIIGEVFELFIGNFGLFGIGFDFVVVKIYSFLEKGNIGFLLLGRKFECYDFICYFFLDLFD